MDSDKRRKRARGYSFATMLVLIGVLGLIIDEKLTGEVLSGLIFFFVCLIISVGIYIFRMY